FKADTHIRPHVEADKENFIYWMDHVSPYATKIYILGDLFEYWYTGIEKHVDNVIKALSHPDIHILPGNRDFLMRDYTHKNIDIITKEEIVFNIYGEKVLIAHGHTLTVGNPGFKLLHRFGWPVLRLSDKFLPATIKDKCATSMVNSSAAIRPPSSSIPRDIALRRGVDKVVCAHLHRGIMTDRLIILPAFMDDGAWMEWDEYGPRFRRLYRKKKC
ncbi:MAG: metallophosphoesterase, partial [Deltaproteobacteria bacterium]|nr:metallophosphoesterase [Deltaproteobacteria bacterium]